MWILNTTNNSDIFVESCIVMFKIDNYKDLLNQSIINKIFNAN
jgi:hypothetical protein